MEDRNEVLAKRVSILADEIWHECYADIISKEQIDYMVGEFNSERAVLDNIKNGYVYHIPVVDGKDAGYFGFVIDGDSVYLSKAYLKKEFRGKGIGKECFGVVEKYAREHGKKRIHLRVNRNNPSVKKYESWGFRKYKEDVLRLEHGFVMDDYLMEKYIN